MALRTNQIKTLTFADIGGSNASAHPAHYFDEIDITPDHPMQDTYFKTKVQAAYRYRFAFTLRRGASAIINSFTEVFVGNPPSSGAYVATDDDPTTNGDDWDSVGGFVEEGASLDIPEPEVTLDSQRLPLITNFSMSGYVGLHQLTSAQASLLNAIHNGPTDLAFKRPDASYMILREVYAQSPFNANTNAGGLHVRGLYFQRGRTRNMENCIEQLADDSLYAWFADRMLAGTRTQLTVAQIDDGSETLLFNPCGFTIRPIINMAGGTLDALRIEGAGYSTSASLVTLDPALS